MTTSSENALSRAPASTWPASLGAVVLVGLVAFTLGVLTAYAQGWLPEQVGSLANSSGSWALAAFLLAMLPRKPALAALAGTVCLIALLVGYIVGADVRGFPSSGSLIVFWGTAAVVAGPLLGLGGWWVKNRPGPLAALGVGAISGVLVGEGVYGLTFVADTTSPPYWWGSIAAGLALLVAVGAASRLPRRGDLGLALGICAVAAAAFVGLYSQGSSLMMVLSFAGSVA